MALQMYFIIVISLFFTYGHSQGTGWNIKIKYFSLFFWLYFIPGNCTQKNVSCNEIKTNHGFKFPHGGPEGSEISVYQNMTLIAFGEASKPIKHTEEVISIDNSSVITRTCQDLHVEHIVPNGPTHIKKICSDFKITDQGKYLDPNDSSSQEDHPHDGVPPYVIVLILTGIFIGICMCVLWYVRRRRKQKGGATVLCCKHAVGCLKKTGISLALTEMQEISGLPSPPNQHGTVESDAEQATTLDSVLVPRNDATANDETLQSICPDDSWSSEEIQTTNNEDLGTSDVNRASNHLTIYRNMRDDPEGVNDNKGKEILRETHTGWTHGDRGHEGHEGHENEEQPLLVNRRAAIQGFDMTGEAAVLVDMPSFDQDQNNSCSTTALPPLLSDARRGVDARHETPHRHENPLQGL